MPSVQIIRKQLTVLSIEKLIFVVSLERKKCNEKKERWISLWACQDGKK